MSEVSAKKLCKEMEFLHLNGGEVVVNQGEKGSTCFVRGSHERNSCFGVNDFVNAAVDPHERSLVTLTPGATFGELCLIEPDSKRSATVIVDPQAQTANFIVLTAASYLRMTRSQTIEVCYSGAFSVKNELEADILADTIQGTITDNIAFLQHLLIFKHWTKMRTSDTLAQSICFGLQYLTRKGSEADSFFVFLRGEAVESVNLTVSESSEMRSFHSFADCIIGGLTAYWKISMGEVRGVQRSITVELTFLGKFDVAGEYLASEKKVSLCPVDIRATTDVDCLMLTVAAHF
ncbi:unnamed protein product [Phytophthora fragariaefolia]|uniref:Unnamed protein product n=1 Tax=Phytophthora fragariaefolia TaxID=1490495 RepID=A0A9W6XBW7_9STRA|nr:unnamed protein product [Phytophthora fragariaefolia]